jgi:hypothetical protein
MSANFTSVVYKTHQSWKLRVMYVGSFLSVGIVLGAILLFGAESGKEITLSYGFGALVSLVSLVMPFTIRCPTCGARWMWLAAKQPHGQWLKWLQAQKVCPSCGSAHNSAT